MLDLMGSGYVIEHCIAAFNSRMKHEIREDYMADILLYISRLFGGEIKTRLHDLRHEETHQEDNRDPKEIVSDLISRYGITVVKNQ